MKKRKFYFQFDDGEPVEIAMSAVGEKLTIEIKEGSMQFVDKEGRTFKIYSEDVK